MTLKDMIQELKDRFSIVPVDEELIKTIHDSIDAAYEAGLVEGKVEGAKEITRMLAEIDAQNN